MCGETSASQSSVHADGGVGAAQATGETSKEMRRSISGGLRERATGTCSSPERIQDVGKAFPAHDFGTPRSRKRILKDLNVGMSQGAHRITPEAEDGRGLPLTQLSLAKILIIHQLYWNSV